MSAVVICVCEGDCTCIVTVKRRRGTSNTNQRGSAKQRRARKLWLLETYRADRTWVEITMKDGSVEWEQAMGDGSGMVRLQQQWGRRATAHLSCRCYRCGRLLRYETLTVDRIKPGCEGGTYRRNNIRPACAADNSETGGHLGAQRKRVKRERNRK